MHITAFLPAIRLRAWKTAFSDPGVLVVLRNTHQTVEIRLAPLRWRADSNGIGRPISSTFIMHSYTNVSDTLIKKSDAPETKL